MLSLLVLMLAFNGALGLTGQASASLCHCDLTQSFCDIGCCCDTDCGTAITSDCYNSKSNSYCPDSTFFSRLGSTYINPQGCFYYNSSTTIIDEVALSSTLTKQLINKKDTIVTLDSSKKPFEANYRLGDIIKISATDIRIIASDGKCLTSSGTNQIVFNLKFGLNTVLSCDCTNCGTTLIPQMYTIFSGANIAQFKGDTTTTFALPKIASTSITSVTLNFIIGTYGSRKIKYIERVTYSTSNTVGTSRKLAINFIFPSQIQPVESNPSFFPQIPSDMFYPIYLLS